MGGSRICIDISNLVVDVETIGIGLGNEGHASGSIPIRSAGDRARSLLEVVLRLCNTTDKICKFVKSGDMPSFGAKALRSTIGCEVIIINGMWSKPESSFCTVEISLDFYGVRIVGEGLIGVVYGIPDSVIKV